MTENKAEKAYKRLLETIVTLRSPEGCPWDKEQTPLSIRRDLIEETFEAVDAISCGEPLHAKEELGDVILNATMMMYMYEQAGVFSVADAMNELTDKLIRRHPHVFAESEGAAVADGKAETAEQVLSQWDKIKENVEHRTGRKSILDEVPSGFPPLLRAYKMQKKASKRGFDWTDMEPVIDKVQEELGEAREAYAEVAAAKQNAAAKKLEPLTVNSSPELDKAQMHLEEEIGDLLFAVVNYARHAGVDPEIALARTNDKFYRRFSYVEQKMKENNIPMDAEHLPEQDAFWEEAKKVQDLPPGSS